MRRTCLMGLLCIAISACSNLPKDQSREAVVPEPETGTVAPDEIPQEQADAPDAPDTVWSPQAGAPVQKNGRRENLMCTTGSEDRHARIGVELLNDEVVYFAYYSKWKPRTCSIDAGRGDARNRWADNGAYSTVTLPDRKGELRIERKGNAYRFGFFNVDRVRYCGMPGKINGTLTVMKGKSNCVVDGVMNGHSS